MVIGVLHEPGVHLHLPGEHRLEGFRHVVPARDLGRPGGQLGIRWNDAASLLAFEGLLTHDVPALVERALVFRRPFGSDMMRGVRRTGREVHEERLVGHQCLLLADPVDRVVGEILRQVIALLGRPVGLDRRRAAVEGRGVLVGLPADEAVEVLEAAADARPGVERSHRARLPDRHLMAFPDLRGRIAVELERLGEGRARVRSDRAVSGRRGGDLGDPAHADGVVIAATQQRGTRRGTQRGRVEARIADPAGSKPLEIRGIRRTTERAVRAEPRIVDQDDQYVRGAIGWTHRPDRREGRIRVLRVVRREPDVRSIRDRQHGTLDLVAIAHVMSPVPT